MSYDFELEGEDEIKPTSSVTFSASLRIYVKSGTLQNRQAFVLIEHIHLFILMTDRFAKLYPYSSSGFVYSPLKRH